MSITDILKCNRVENVSLWSPLMAGWVLEGSGRMCLKMGAGRWDMVLFDSPARRALFSCSWASWRDGAAKRQVVGAHDFTDLQGGAPTCRIPVRSGISAPLLVFLRRQSSVWTQRGWASAAHRPALTPARLYTPSKIPGYVSVPWKWQQRFSELESKKERTGCFHLSFIDCC